jgi:3-hydroxyisobutyrate dehydrogenase-like beta-hydroxyacid dehydrogenase
MKQIGFIGLGNMGMGMAKNLLEKGFAVKGFARRKEVGDEFKKHGGILVDSVGAIAEGSDVVFIMVLNGQQVIEVIEGGLKDGLEKGATVIISATIGKSYVQEAERLLVSAGAEVMDIPVSGGRNGANNGTLTLMAAARKSVLDDHNEVLRAIAGNIHHVGEVVGQGQVVKACLQAMIGVSYEALFETMVLGAKADLDPEVLSMVINSSFVGSTLTRDTTELIMDRKFTNAGSHISSMHKDFAISMDLARELGVPMPASSVAMEMFQAGMTAIPEGDNWCIVQLLEKLAATEVRRKDG